MPAQVLSRRTGCEVHPKVEGANPTGSSGPRYDHGHHTGQGGGRQAVICASTGSTSTSAAAYAVRAGMVCAVLVPRGKIALGKMGQGPRARREDPPGRRELRRLPHPRA
ncbi:pyridoxal-phosphate dependent enzyme [Streptomyces sp. L7]